eukprot:2141361-Pleurochrysis_carterae.AAC.5
MVGTPDVPPSRGARLLEANKDDARSGFLARVRGSRDPRAMRASRSSRVGGGNQDHSESVLTVHGSSALGMADALHVSSPRNARPLDVKDDAHSGILARVRGSPDSRAMRASRSNQVGGGNQDDSDGMLAVSKPSGVGKAGTPDGSPSRDAQQFAMKDSVPSCFLAK